jgi:2-keto-4-pentenoate hydratase/2-oxohepta-3-ene-1,7-dioic acid hydratase in catechol pathway
LRTANLAGRSVLVFTVEGSEVALDVEQASDGRFGPDPQSVYAEWDAFREWAATIPASGVPFDRAELDAPVPRPRQVFAIGVNYREHADEAGYPSDSIPVTFTKFPSSLTGPDAQVALPPGSVDWEVELVAVLGRRAENVSADEAWSYVAGLTVGQDLSEREAQMEGSKPQYSLAKSHTGFGPTGPWVVATEDFDDPTDLAISCSLSGESMQSSRTSRMIYPVAEIIARLSSVLTLFPGDIIFTGTPSGVGNARTPKRFIGPDDTLHSEIEGIGSLENNFRTR